MDGVQQTISSGNMTLDGKAMLPGNQKASAFGRPLSAESAANSPDLSAGSSQVPTTEIQERKTRRLTIWQQIQCALISIGLKMLPIKVLRDSLYQFALTRYTKTDRNDVSLKERLLEILCSFAPGQNPTMNIRVRLCIDNEQFSPVSLMELSPVPPYRPELFRLDYRTSLGGAISAHEQAKTLLNHAKSKIDLNNRRSVIAFTYSANLAQARDIEKGQLNGEWKTDISGSNQAQIVRELMKLLEQPENSAYRGRIIPAAIPTIEYTYGSRGLAMQHTTEQQIDQSIAHIKQQMLNRGVRLLVLQNQDTVNNPNHPYAVGGGVAGRATGASNAAYIKQKLDELMASEGS